MMPAKKTLTQTVLTRSQAVEEAKLQKKALASMGLWRMFLFSLTTCMVLLAYFGIQAGGGWFVPGVIAAVLGGISLLLAFTVNLCIRNGHRNVERILESLK